MTALNAQRATFVLGIATLLMAAGCPAASDGDGGPFDDEPCEALPELLESECAALFASVLPEALPPSPGNAHADEDGAAYLGFAIFYDARFSANLDVRCASCHLPELFFDDDDPVPEAGLGDVYRNTPTVLSSAWDPVQFWDGRADSLWSQPLFALEAPNEMGISRLAIAHRIKKSYRSGYEGTFGPLPDLDDADRFPAEGRPGEPAFDDMEADDQDAVNRVFANVGKALDAYMRKLAAGRSRFDAFALGDKDALSDIEKRGATVFVENGCNRCHSGPLFSDGRYHNLGLPTREGAPPDVGRASGAAVLADGLFSLRGPYADAPPADVPSRESLLAEAEDPALLGAIRTPTLRNVSLSAPYGHNGCFVTLEEVIAHHLADEVEPGYVGERSTLLVPGELSDDDMAALVSFLRALDGAYPPEPWSSWPDR